MTKILEGHLTAAGLKFALVVSRFNDFITSKLLEGAKDAIIRSGGDEKNITVVKVPGSFEIPLTARKLAETNEYDGIVCLGAVLRGDTSHHDYIATELTKGISHVMLEFGVPVANGVITAENLEQAIERAGTKKGNKGKEAALSVVEMANLLKQLK